MGWRRTLGARWMDGWRNRLQLVNRGEVIGGRVGLARIGVSCVRAEPAQNPQLLASQSDVTPNASAACTCLHWASLSNRVHTVPLGPSTVLPLDQVPRILPTCFSHHSLYCAVVCNLRRASASSSERCDSPSCNIHERNERRHLAATSSWGVPK